MRPSSSNTSRLGATMMIIVMCELLLLKEKSKLLLIATLGRIQEVRAKVKLKNLYQQEGGVFNTPPSCYE